MSGNGLFQAVFKFISQLNTKIYLNVLDNLTLGPIWDYDLKKIVKNTKGSPLIVGNCNIRALEEDEEKIFTLIIPVRDSSAPPAGMTTTKYGRSADFGCVRILLVCAHDDQNQAK